MRSYVNGVLKTLFLSSALSGCGANLSDFVHAREGDLPEVRNEWPIGSSGHNFLQAKIVSPKEVYIGWRMSFQPESR